MDELTYHDIAKDTGLKIPFMRRVFKASKASFPHRIGQSNKTLFSNNALIIWREVRAKKDQGLTVKDITNFLKNELATSSQSPRKQGVKLSETTSQTKIDDDALSLIQQGFNKALQAKEETIVNLQKQLEEKNTLIAELQGQVKLLMPPATKPKRRFFGLLPPKAS